MYKMNSSTSLTSSEFDKTYKDSDDTVKINEEVSLTKKQYEVLKIICDTYKQSISEYIETALIEKMHFDIDEGDFSSILLKKLNEDDGKNNSPLSGRRKENDSDIDSLVGYKKPLCTRIKH
jgi:hypothetical protein